MQQNLSRAYALRLQREPSVSRWRRAEELKAQRFDSVSSLSFDTLSQFSIIWMINYES